MAFRLIPYMNDYLIAGTGKYGANYLSKVNGSGILVWTKKFETDAPLSFTVFEDLIYFTSSIPQATDSKKDMVFGRLNGNGETESDCDFINDFFIPNESLPFPASP